VSSRSQVVCIVEGHACEIPQIHVLNSASRTEKGGSRKCRFRGLENKLLEPQPDFVVLHTKESWAISSFYSNMRLGLELLLRHIISSDSKKWVSCSRFGALGI